MNGRIIGSSPQNVCYLGGGGQGSIPCQNRVRFMEYLIAGGIVIFYLILFWLAGKNTWHSDHYGSNDTIDKKPGSE